MVSRPLSRRPGGRSLGDHREPGRRLLLYVELVVGLVLLIGGAELAVTGSIRLARHMGVSSLLVGLTVVALGTSLPELFVSALAAERGEPHIALGNVIGSNIFNLSVILAIGAILRPVHIELRLLRLEIPFVLLISLLFMSMAVDGRVGQVDGLILLGLFAAYLVYVARIARQEASALRKRATEAAPPSAREADPRAGEAAPQATGAEGATRAGPSPWRWVGAIVVGLALLLLGARWLVDSVIELTRLFGVSERVISLTIVAGGTSLPELAASVVATLRREEDLAVGNLLGSNIFNTLGILGVSATLEPLGPTAPFLRLDAAVLILTALLIAPLARSGWRLTRWEGVLLLGVYVVYLALVLAGVGSGIG